MNKFNDLKKEEIILSIKSSKSLCGVLKSLSCHTNSSNLNKLRKFIEDEKIETTHFNEKRKTKKDYEKNPNKCKFCGKELPFDKRDNLFCDHSCAAKYNNSKGVKRHFSKFCLNCGKEFKKTQKASFCNNTCYAEYNRKNYIERWKKGEESGVVGGSEISQILRDYLINEANNSCEVCGWSQVNPYTGRVPLQIHHIDGDCTNNTRENLQVLCPNCHSLTQNFGSRNKKSSRRDKRCKYYFQQLNNNKESE